MADPIKFGTDGWRGVIARDFTFQNCRRVAQAIADYVKEEQIKDKKGPFSGPMVIGYDKRFQSDAFAREIAKVLEANQMHPILMADALPTPAVSYMTKKLGGVGVMVTASHNPPSYNGVKIKIDGRAALDPVTKGVEAWVDRTAPTRAAEIKVKSYRDVYVQYLKARADLSKIKSKIKKPIVIDYMHGSGTGLMTEVLKAKNLVEIRAKHDPLFGGVRPEPIEQYLAALSDAVKRNKATVGLALDGDADRFGLVDENGKYLTPCQVFPMIALYLIEKKKYKKKIVQSVSLGYLAERIAGSHGAADRGNRHVDDVAESILRVVGDADAHPAAGDGYPLVVAGVRKLFGNLHAATLAGRVCRVLMSGLDAGADGRNVGEPGVVAQR